MPSKSSFKLPNTPENKAALLKLSALLRELFERDEYRTVATYVTQCSELQDAHDEFLKHPKGTEENRRAYGIAKKLFDNARIYAHKNNLPHPNEMLAACGYSPV
jgi:hypothetical protein